jgi:hypothetical protein
VLHDGRFKGFGYLDLMAKARVINARLGRYFCFYFTGGGGGGGGGSGGGGGGGGVISRRFAVYR